MTPYELAVGLRYTRARKGSGRNAFISFIALISMAGIALGVAALIVVLSVMNGFQQELRNRILAVASHIEVRGMPALADWERVAKTALADPRVTGAAPFITGQAMLSAGDVNRGVLMRGIDPAREDEVADIGKHMRAGSLADLKPGEFGIVLGAELARALGVRVGETVVAITPQGTVTPAGTLPRVKASRSWDCSRSDVRVRHRARDPPPRVAPLPRDGVTGVRLKIDDLFAAPAVAACSRGRSSTRSRATGPRATRTSSARSRSRSA